MVWKRIQTKADTFANSTSARTVTLPSSVTAGNFIAVEIAMFNDVTLTVSDGVNGSYAQAGSYALSVGNKAAIFYFYNSGAGSVTVTVTPSATAFLTISVSEYSGIVSASDPIDNSATATSASSTAIQCGPITVSQAGDLILGSASLETSQTFVICNGATALISGQLVNSTQPLLALEASADANFTLDALVNTATRFAFTGSSFKAVPTVAGGTTTLGVVIGLRV